MDIFVYGTLQSAGLMQAVAGGNCREPIAARFSGYRLSTLKGNVVPCLVADPGSAVDGLVFPGLSNAQLARLHLYEDAFGYHVSPETVETADGPRDVQVYLPDHGPCDADGPWSFVDWQKDHERPAIYAATEVFAHNPLPQGDELRRFWHMIEGRAWAKHRAPQAPASLRHPAEPDDIHIHKMHPPVGSFFRLQSMNISHRQFSGPSSDVLPREVFVGVDAAILLPYDPVREKVLLVEQVRMGPVVRRDPNPWMLEAVAGMVDARETPEAAARREAAEEANVSLRHLEHAGSYYPSPGGTTDYFYTYVGLCDLPMEDSYLGGLAEEGEDLRLHPVSFDDAMAMTQTGEIAAGPLFHLLYWLAWHRGRLRTLV